ncbi:hypothetical protein IEO21_00388 [Rhodonia placenta]|uniref:Uncharacterized protein n=1 Tax=Rhodonia placenta TaxID=104341 RepID=A0A8H7PBT9_9APHY|nr:hypothetical protein IEO21_00388 [Postia placenta]
MPESTQRSIHAEDPPYYILVSHSAAPTNAPGVPSTTLSHPVIQYHYADDPADALLPQYPGEQILIIDYDPNSSAAPAVKSLSSDLAVTGLRVTSPPGARAAEDDMGRNEKMYILETTMLPEENMDEDEYMSPSAVLTRFRQRNAVLRLALEYGDTAAMDDTIQQKLTAPGPQGQP